MGASTSSPAQSHAPQRKPAPPRPTTSRTPGTRTAQTTAAKAAASKAAASKAAASKAAASKPAAPVKPVPPDPQPWQRDGNDAEWTSQAIGIDYRARNPGQISEPPRPWIKVQRTDVPPTPRFAQRDSSNDRRDIPKGTTDVTTIENCQNLQTLGSDRSFGWDAEHQVGDVGRVLQQRGIIFFTHLRRTSGSMLEECLLKPAISHVIGHPVSQMLKYGAMINCGEGARLVAARAAARAAASSTSTAFTATSSTSTAFTAADHTTRFAAFFCPTKPCSPFSLPFHLQAAWAVSAPHHSAPSSGVASRSSSQVH